MKKYFTLIFLLPLLISAQDLNKIIVEEKSGKPFAIGYCNNEVFADSNFSWWFKPEYENCEINSNDIDAIKERISDLHIKIVLGTWCSDSRREVPRFLKILNEINFNMNNLKIICVDRDKKADGTEVENLNIKFVPTFILFRGGNEISRIVETPQTTLQEDLKKMLK